MFEWWKGMTARRIVDTRPEKARITMIAGDSYT